jgi:N-acetyl-gamma-glutamylphosphate reductase
VIDLSSDHRFDESWVYGLPEMDSRAHIRTATRIANPGCYATGSILSLLPLFRSEDEVDEPIIRGVPNIFGISGYSGAGTTPGPRNDMQRLENNIMAYSLVGHTHEREVSHQLSQFGNAGSRDLAHGVRFMPHVASHFRGIHLTVSVDLSGKLAREDLLYRYRTFYEGESTIMVNDEIPEVKNIVGTP